jgi:hypothetical protein
MDDPQSSQKLEQAASDVARLSRCVTCLMDMCLRQMTAIAKLGGTPSMEDVMVINATTSLMTELASRAVCDLKIEA